MQKPRLERKTQSARSFKKEETKEKSKRYTSQEKKDQPAIINSLNQNIIIRCISAKGITILFINLQIGTSNQYHFIVYFHGNVFEHVLGKQ